MNTLGSIPSNSVCTKWNTKAYFGEGLEGKVTTVTTINITPTSCLRVFW